MNAILSQGKRTYDELSYHRGAMDVMTLILSVLDDANFLAGVYEVFPEWKELTIEELEASKRTPELSRLLGLKKNYIA